MTLRRKYIKQFADDKTSLKYTQIFLNLIYT